MNALIFILLSVVMSFNTLLYAQSSAYFTGSNTLYLAEMETCNLQYLGSASSTISWSDIALNPINDTLYGVSGSRLYWIDKTNGQEHFVTLLSEQFINSLTFAKDGTLYGAKGTENHLFTIDPSTGIATDLGEIGTGLSANATGDIAFYNDTLYYLGFAGLSMGSYLIKVNIGNLSQSVVVGKFQETTAWGLTAVGCNTTLYMLDKQEVYRVDALGQFNYDTTTFQYRQLCQNLLPFTQYFTGAAGINEDTGIPNLNLGSDQTVCLGDTVLLDVSSSTGQYLWHNGDTSSTFQITQAGEYWVVISDDSCVISDTLRVTYEAPLNDLNLQDTVLCGSLPVVVDLTAFNLDYIWTDNSTTAVFQIQNSGVYGVTATGGNCDVYLTDSIEVNYKPLPLVSLDSLYNLCIGDQLTLDVEQEGATYLWQDNSTSPTLLITEAGIYSVEISNNCGNISQEITVLKDCNCIAGIPDIFTPNGDGVNDFFRPVLDCALQKGRLRVFNRWGQTVCDTRDMTIGWDGYFKGSISPSDTYIYLFEFEEGDQIPQSIKGQLTLLL